MIRLALWSKVPPCAAHKHRGREDFRHGGDSQPAVLGRLDDPLLKVFRFAGPSAGRRRILLGRQQHVAEDRFRPDDQVDSAVALDGSCDSPVYCRCIRRPIGVRLKRDIN